MRKTMITGIILVILSCIYFASTSNVATVTAVGLSGIIGNDISNARMKALNQAFAVAIEQSVKVMISHEVEVKNSVAIKDKILKKASGYIKSFQILSEGPLPPQKDPSTGKWVKLYQVKIRAVVGRTNLKNALSDIIFNLGDPRILVISGNPEHQTPLENEIETIFENKLMSKGFRVYDRKQLKEVENRNKLAMLKVGTKADLFDIGLWFGVDMIVESNFKSVNQGKFNGMTSVYSMLNYKVIYTKTGQLVDVKSLSESAVFANYQSGVYALAKDLVDRSNISNDIVKWLVAEKASLAGQKYSLIFSGFTQGELGNFENYLHHIYGIKSFNRTQIALSSAKYEFKYFGNPTPLVNALSKFENGDYSVELNGNEILMIKKKESSFEIKVEGVKNFSDVESIKDVISSLLSATRIDLVSFNDRILILKIEASATDMLNIATELQKEFEIVSVEEKLIVLKTKS